MRRNIYGEIEITSIDYAQFVVDELTSQNYQTFQIKENTDHGFLTESKISGTGIYCIYRKEKPVYVGCTENSIRVRLGRFFAAVRGTEHWDENHQAAYKFVDVFGRNLDHVTFKFCNISSNDIPKNIQLEEIENEVVNVIKPYFNNQTCNLHRFQKEITVHSANGVIQYA